MDPISQGVLGSAAAQSLSKKHIAGATLLGCLSGMAPDLDVLIRSSSDPLLFLEYHRQFTHSLLFIPLGGLICSLVLHFIIGKRSQLSFKQSYLFCTAGYATHALLDACTTYGTMLFWPFSDARIAWNTVSVIDPLFTVPALILVIFGAIKKKPVLGRIALIWAIAYPGIGLIQRDRAITVGKEIASSRGHQPIRLEAKPSFANLLVWKIVYETPHYFYVDAARMGTTAKIYKGDKVKKLNITTDFPWLNVNSQQAKDIDRFKWFSNNYIAKDPNNKNRIIDVRYSMVPNQVNSLWSIELSPEKGNQQHADYLTHRDNNEKSRELFYDMIFNQ